ncbi:MAG TPA: outer membrane protein assembly factor BamD [Verrucomicrobiae bacterium]|nr:outer membrane protein assembly factor BamD [Verrucomicrobiae bacterium]
MVRNRARFSFAIALLAVLAAGSGCRKKLYENPITKDTQQPDKVLYDTAIDDVEHGRYERARIELQTLMNTYDTSEYLAKAKLAVADSWYREGGARGMAQAEAEYKDFILFYKNMEEAAEAQMKICNMQFDQMDKADRDPQHALRAQEECKNLLLQFPNSQYATDAEQRLRGIQEVLADEEFKVETFYSKKGSFAASANRGQTLTEQFPLYSSASDALWMLATDYQHMGDNFENQQAAALGKIVSQYPLSVHADEAKLRLQAMNRPVPEVDPVAYARAVYEADNKEKRGTMSKLWGPFGSRPYLGTAAKSGPPSTEPFRPGIPASVPATATGAIGTSANPGVSIGAGTTGVSGTVVGNTNALDKLPDARMSRGGGEGSGGGSASGGTAPTGTVSGQVLGTQTPAQTVPAGTAPATNPQANPATNPTTPAVQAPAAPARAATTTGGKPKSVAQQEADVKREQDQMKKEKAKILEQNKKRYEELQRMAKKQADEQTKKKAQEDAERKKAADAAAKKARKQHISTPDDQTDKQPDKPADKTGKTGGGGETPAPKQ